MLQPGTQVLVPRGVGNGFQATGPGSTQYLYCFDQEWVPGMAGSACSPLDPALGIDWPLPVDREDRAQVSAKDRDAPTIAELRSEEHTSELQSLMRISYAVFCLQKKKNNYTPQTHVKQYS